MSKKILVIEDNTEVRENLCEILELDSYEVVSAINGKVGIEKAISEMPDLIICDVMMPELDGFGVLKILNKNPKLNHIPLIFLTAKAEKSDLRKGMGLGADDYITKPFDDVELLDAIEMRLKKAERINTDFDKSEQGLQTFFSNARAEQELQNLSLDRELRKYSKKEVVYEEGQIARWLYFVVEGQVKIFQVNEYGKELTIEILSSGDFFGHYPLLNETAYSNNASALTNATLRLIPKSDFASLIFNNRDFAAKFIRMIANNAENTEKQLIEMAYGTVRKKVANALLKFVEKTGKEEELIIRASREELANVAGTAKETLIRTLSDFKSEKLISTDSAYIKILDKTNLEDLIG